MSETLKRERKKEKEIQLTSLSVIILTIKFFSRNVEGSLKVVGPGGEPPFTSTVKIG